MIKSFSTFFNTICCLLLQGWNHVMNDFGIILNNANVVIYPVFKVRSFWSTNNYLLYLIYLYWLFTYRHPHKSKNNNLFFSCVCKNNQSKFLKLGTINKNIKIINIKRREASSLTSWQNENIFFCGHRNWRRRKYFFSYFKCKPG